MVTFYSVKKRTKIEAEPTAVRKTYNSRTNRTTYLLLAKDNEGNSLSKIISKEDFIEWEKKVPQQDGVSGGSAYFPGGSAYFPGGGLAPSRRGPVKYQKGSSAYFPGPDSQGLAPKTDWRTLL
jgi:hypothetical protein